MLEKQRQQLFSLIVECPGFKVGRVNLTRLYLNTANDKCMLPPGLPHLPTLHQASPTCPRTTRPPIPPSHPLVSSLSDQFDPSS